MMNDNVDAVFARRVRECTAGRHLPFDFPDRLVSALRRRRRIRRFRLATLLALLTMVGGLYGYFSMERQKQTGQAMLVNKDSPPQGEQATGWILFGFVRECIRRNKVTRKKEEEEE